MPGQGAQGEHANNVIKCWGKQIAADFEVKNLHLTRRDAASGEQRMVAAIEQLQDVIKESKAAISEPKSETVNYKLGVDTMQGQLRHHTARVEKIETSLDRVVASSPIALDAAHAAPSPPLGDETRGSSIAGGAVAASGRGGTASTSDGRGSGASSSGGGSGLTQLARAAESVGEPAAGAPATGGGTEATTGGGDVRAPSPAYGACSRSPSPAGFGPLQQMRNVPVQETLKGVASSDAYSRYMKNNATVPNIFNKQDLSRANQVLVF